MGTHAIGQIAQDTAVPNLAIVPSTMDLLGVEMEISKESDRVFRLRKALASVDALAYSYVLVDCPPSFNLLTMNAMAAAHSVLVPLQCEFFALEGLSQLLETVDQVRQTVNPGLDIQGIVLTMFDSRNNLAQQVVSDVRLHLGDKVYHTLIPAMCGCPRHLPMASRPFSMTLNAPEVRLISSWPRKSFSAKAAEGRLIVSVS